MAPLADPADGILDYAMIERVSRPTMFRLLPEVMNGTHARFKPVRIGRFQTMDIHLSRPLPIHTDGEMFAGFQSEITGLHLELLGRALRLIVSRSLPGARMRTLANTLHDLEPGERRIIAERWGIEQDDPAGGLSSDRLAHWMLQPANLAELLAGLTDGEEEVLATLRRHAGRMPLAEAKRRFGDWRRMAPRRRDRLQPHRNPSGPLESLGYSGLIGHAFADAPGGAQEFVFLPSDLLPLTLPSPRQSACADPGRRSWAGAQRGHGVFRRGRRDPAGCLAPPPLRAWSRLPLGRIRSCLFSCAPKPQPCSSRCWWRPPRSALRRTARRPSKPASTCIAARGPLAAAHRLEVVQALEWTSARCRASPARRKPGRVIP